MVEVRDDVAWLRSKAELAPNEKTAARYKAIADRMQRFIYAAEGVVSLLQTVGDRTGWKDGDETDRVYSWDELAALRSVLRESSDGVADVQRSVDLQEVLDNIVESGLLSEEQYDVLADAINRPSRRD